MKPGNEGNISGDTVNQDQQKEQSQQQLANNNETITIDVNEFNKMKETIKKQSSNFDRVNTEKVKLENDLKKEREKTLTSKQLEELKQEEYQTQLKKREEELKHQTLLFEKTKYINEKKFEAELLEIVNANDLEEFKENCDRLNKVIARAVQKEKDALLMQSNPIPNTSGKKTNPDIFTLEEIEKNSKGNIKWVQENWDKIEKSYKYWENNK